MHGVQEKREYTVLLEGLHRCAKEYRCDGWIVFLWTSLDMCNLCSLLASLCVCHTNKYQFGKRAAPKTLRYLRRFFLSITAPSVFPSITSHKPPSLSCDESWGCPDVHGSLSSTPLPHMSWLPRKPACCSGTHVCTEPHCESPEFLMLLFMEL